MINHRWRVWLRVFIFWIPIAVKAQVQTFDQALVWTRYNVRWQMQPKWALHLEADNRIFIKPSYGAHQFIAHLHIHRRFLRNQEIWGGFTFSRVAAQRPEIEGLAMAEYRLWQAFFVRNKVFQHRLRTEQRFFPESNSGGFRVAFRIFG
ncbi:MAG TPA: hypothetical protein DCF33_03910 [Saprospirales bacterium]|nr:hypothetical protein [Saprospirales bacterium]